MPIGNERTNIEYSEMILRCSLFPEVKTKHTVQYDTQIIIDPTGIYLLLESMSTDMYMIQSIEAKKKPTAMYPQRSPKRAPNIKKTITRNIGDKMEIIFQGIFFNLFHS